MSTMQHDHVQQLCDAIYDHQVSRKHVIKLEVKIMNSAVAHVASAIGLEFDADESTRKKVWNRAKKIVGRAVNGKKQDEDDHPIVLLRGIDLDMAHQAMKPIVKRRDEIEATMRELGAQCPGAMTMIEATPGLDALGIAVVVGEAGNLSNYSTKRKLWRRLGFGMAPGHEQHSYPTWRRMKTLTADDWIVAGYSPGRRSQIYGVVTVPLFMHKAKNRYGAIYETRRRHTMRTHPEWWADAKGKPKVNPKTGEPASAHGMNDAKAIITKEFLEDLRREWIRSRGSVNAMPGLAQSDRDAA